MHRETPSCAAAAQRRAQVAADTAASGTVDRYTISEIHARRTRHPQVCSEVRGVVLRAAHTRPTPRRAEAGPGRPRASARVPRLDLRDVAKRSLVREPAYALWLRERGRGGVQGSARRVARVDVQRRRRAAHHVTLSAQRKPHPLPTARGTLQACALRRGGDPRQRPARRLHISGRSPTRSRPGCSRRQRPSRPRCRRCPPGRRPLSGGRRRRRPSPCPCP